MIWCVEDDPGILEIEAYTLRAAGFEVRGFESGTALREAMMNSAVPELIILDVMLPGEDGFSLLNRLRSSAKFSDIPIIMATARIAEIDRIRGLDGGADYYLMKPFGIMELQSCVRAVLRRYKHDSSHAILTAGGLKLDTAGHIASIDGKPLTLTYKEFELLQLFMENPGIAFSRDHLFEVVWGTDYIGESRTIDTHIQTLRKKLGSYASIIETVRNIGYRMEAKHEA